MAPLINWPLATLLLACLCLGSVTPASAGDSDVDKNPAELGRVHWLRDFDSAQKEAASSKKPMLLLFQEIPG